MTARKPEVVSLTRWPTIRETIAREDVNPDAPYARAAIAAAADEARADDQVGAVVEDRLQHAGDLARIVLPVTVDLDGELEAVLEGVLVSGLDGARRSRG